MVVFDSRGPDEFSIKSNIPYCYGTTIKCVNIYSFSNSISPSLPPLNLSLPNPQRSNPTSNNLIYPFHKPLPPTLLFLQPNTTTPFPLALLRSHSTLLSKLHHTYSRIYNCRVNPISHTQLHSHLFRASRTLLSLSALFHTILTPPAKPRNFDTPDSPTNALDITPTHTAVILLFCRTRSYPIPHPPADPLPSSAHRLPSTLLTPDLSLSNAPRQLSRPLRCRECRRQSEG